MVDDMRKTHKMRAVRLPFGDWHYFPQTSLNIVKLAHRPDALWKPVHISVALTSKCEKCCDFCYANSGPMGNTLWKFENIVNLVESCDQNGVFAITLGGGEPTLWNDRSANTDFYDLLNELSAFGCDVSFTTSAVPGIDWKRIPLKILPRLSVHHHQETGFICNEINTAVQGRGRVPAVNLLVRKGEINELLGSAEKLAKTGVRDFLLIPLKPVGRASDSCSGLIPTDSELQELTRLFPVSNVKLSSCRRIENQNDTFLGCGAGDWFVSIDETRCVKSCSFNKTGIALSQFDYREILDALPFLNRLECHTRIRLSPNS